MRQEVARRANHCCSYCRSQEQVAGTLFTVDHIIPQALGGSDDLDNLCLACWDCNRIKQAHVTGVDPSLGKRVTLFHPQRQRWPDHFCLGSRRRGGRWNDRGWASNCRATATEPRFPRPCAQAMDSSWVASSR
ncbi:MAG TPA: HNH endonuclease [Promineifilum sp.]|nr:HNH endonuclease [Promineifilum sp.]